jgi:hypothetical protein
MEDLPKDVLGLIFGRLPDEDVQSVALTCKLFKRVLYDDQKLRRMVLYGILDQKLKNDSTIPLVLVEIYPEHLTTLSLAIVSGEEFRGINKFHYFFVHSLWIKVFIGTAAYLLDHTADPARWAWAVVQLFQKDEGWQNDILWNCEVICKIKGFFISFFFLISFFFRIFCICRFKLDGFFVCSISSRYRPLF